MMPCHKLDRNFCNFLAISGLVLYIFYISLSRHHPCCQTRTLFARFKQFRASESFSSDQSPTNVTHLVFGIAGSVNTWRAKRSYTEAWWKPNVTRGYLFLDNEPTNFQPWPLTSPPFRVSESTSRFQAYNKHLMPHAIRMVRVISETFRENDRGVRWYVMADDDTVFMVNNLVHVLSRYDHNNYYYIGANSECISSNVGNSYGMAFGGAGYALSYPLAKAVSQNMDECIKRYPTLYGSDHILQSCIADIGVSLTQEHGFHQICKIIEKLANLYEIDLHKDLSGFLSAHPQTPFISLHHLDVVRPIFPTLDRYASISHLMEAAKADESRLLQQTICYDHKQKNWSLSLSWGYSAQIYEKIHRASYLQRPLETFGPWTRRMKDPPPYLFNTRFPSKDPCEAPHVFFFDKARVLTSHEHIVTSYIRRWPRGLQPACSSGGNHSADHISLVRVFSPLVTSAEIGGGSRRECCDIMAGTMDKNVTEVKIRACMENEMVG